MKIFSNTEKNNSIGLDISDLSIKLVQLKKSKGKNKFQAIGKYNLKEGVVSDGEIINQEELIKAIKEIINKPIFGSVNTKNVVASLPENKTFIKTFNVEKSANQLGDMVISAIENTIPYSIDEIYYDWQVVSQNQNSYEVLFAATPKKTVDSYIEVLNKSNLSVNALETESEAICRCVLKEESSDYKNKSDRSIALIDIGAKRTTMIIYSNQSIILTVDIDVSGESTTKTIAETLQINTSQAEKAKIICGLDKTKAEGIISDILSSMIAKITDRIKQALAYYSDNNPDLPPISEMYISGGGSNIKDLDKVISSILSIPVSGADVFINLDEQMEKHYNSFTETHNISLDILKNLKNKKRGDDKTTISSKQNSSLAYTTAIGLALRNISN